MNLALNARDAMQGRGVFTVRTQRVVDDDGTEWVQVTADDTGPGVPPDARPRIFEPFFTTKDRGHGTGLGLSISYGIITGAGGTIAIAESPEGGARFVVRLPAQARVAVSQAERTAGVRPSGGVERILLVDDDDGVGTVAERVLVRAGYTVARADHPARALQMMTEARFALVITDVVMPGMSGPQMAREAVRRHGPMRLLFISGFPDDDLLMEALRVHQAAFLPKPLSRDALLQAVRTLLDAPE
jgi:CheY-like chemotaxis protein